MKEASGAEGAPQPNSRDCFVCGLENPFGLQLRFYQTAPSEVMAEFMASDRYQGYPGVVHGGVVTAVLDEVASRAYMGLDPASTRFMYTARITVRFRKNVPVGEPLKAVGRGLRRKSRSATAEAYLYGPDGELMAEAEALLVNLPAEALGGADLNSLGWRIYPDLLP